MKNEDPLLQRMKNKPDALTSYFTSFQFSILFRFSFSSGFWHICLLPVACLLGFSLFFYYLFHSHYSHPFTPVIGASVLPSWFELHQIAGSGEGATRCRGRSAQIQAGLCQQSRWPPKADRTERKTDVSHCIKTSKLCHFFCGF